MNEYKATLSKNGRVVIPSALRKELGIHSGDEITFTLDRGNICLMSKKKSLIAVQELFSKVTKTKNLSDELIEMRRHESSKE